MSLPSSSFTPDINDKMSGPLSEKRRRIDQSVNTLKKPFVSPLKISKRKRSSSLRSEGEPSVSYQPSTISHTTQVVPVKAVPSTESLLSQASKPCSTPKARSPKKTSPGDVDATEHFLRRDIMKLELQIRNLRHDLDTLNQAARLQSSSSKADLEELACKWRLASQAAAEELLGSVKDRVDRMGGVEAWREKERGKYEKSNRLGLFAKQQGPDAEDDADCEFDSDGEELPQEEQRWRKKMKRKAREEASEAAEPPDEMFDDDNGKKMVWQEAGGDNETFTMDMMLRSLNIELEVIGYEKANQRWTT